MLSIRLTHLCADVFPGYTCLHAPLAPCLSSLMRLLPISLAPLLVACQPCDSTSFPVSTPNLQCFGLTPSPTASSEAECVAACCALGSSACAVWQWCVEGSSCRPQTYPCWLGQPTHDSYGGGAVCKNSSGWIGGLRATPPVVGLYYALVPVDPASGLPLAGSVRHCQSITSMDSYSPGSPDFEWRAVEALSGDPSAISLQPLNYFVRKQHFFPPTASAGCFRRSSLLTSLSLRSPRTV